jgi:hypothetical protein
VAIKACQGPLSPFSKQEALERRVRARRQRN